MFYQGIHLLFSCQVCSAVHVGVTWTQNLLLTKWTDSYSIRQGALASELPHTVALPSHAANLMSWFQLPPLLPKPSLVRVCQPGKQAAEHAMDSCHSGVSPNEVVQHLHQTKDSSTGPLWLHMLWSSSSVFIGICCSCQPVSIPLKLKPSFRTWQDLPSHY